MAGSPNLKSHPQQSSEIRERKNNGANITVSSSSSSSSIFFYSESSQMLVLWKLPSSLYTGLTILLFQDSYHYLSFLLHWVTARCQFVIGKDFVWRKLPSSIYTGIHYNFFKILSIVFLFISSELHSQKPVL